MMMGGEGVDFLGEGGGRGRAMMKAQIAEKVNEKLMEVGVCGCDVVIFDDRAYLSIPILIPSYAGARARLSATPHRRRSSAAC